MMTEKQSAHCPCCSQVYDGFLPVIAYDLLILTYDEVQALDYNYDEIAKKIDVKKELMGVSLKRRVKQNMDGIREMVRKRNLEYGG